MAKKSFKKGVKSLIESKTNMEGEIQMEKETQKKREPQSLTIQTSDICTVQNVEGFHAQLLDIPASVKEVTIKGDNIADIDLSFIQVLKAFRKYSLEKGIQTNIQITLSENALQLLEISGIETEF